jgi:hypothetical protein
VNVIVTGYSDGKKIHAIKGIRAVTGLGLKEAKQVADDIDAGRRPEITLVNPEHASELEAMGVAYQMVPVNVPLAAFVDALGAYPRHLTVGDLHEVLRAAVAIEKSQNGGPA